MAWTRDQMAARAALELKDGYYVNLGIGIPTLVANNIPAGMTVTLQPVKSCFGAGIKLLGHEFSDAAGQAALGECGVVCNCTICPPAFADCNRNVSPAVDPAIPISPRAPALRWSP